MFLRRWPVLASFGLLIATLERMRTRRSDVVRIFFTILGLPSIQRYGQGTGAVEGSGLSSELGFIAWARAPAFAAELCGPQPRGPIFVNERWSGTSVGDIAMQVRILTLNVWNAEGDPRRPECINQTLATLKPDLIAFQEVIQTRDDRMLDRLLAKLDFEATHQADLQHSTPPFADRYGGSAVATRWPHRVVEVLDMRVAGAADVPWATLATVVEIPEAGELLFVGATMAWRPAAEAVRERQALAIAELDARHRRGLPTIIAGDLNADPGSASIRFLTGRQSLDGRSVLYHDAWEIAGDGRGYTWGVDNPNGRAGSDQIIGQPDYRKRFDYVLVGSWDAHPESHAHIRSAALAFDKPINGIWASDHFGVVVDLDIGMNN